jgi:hypothetical protein
MKKDKKSVVRFIKNPDGTITDNQLNIIWGPTPQERMTWEEAGKACKKLSINGQRGWRLSTVNESFSLVDRAKYRPAIDTNFFGDTKIDDWYWTSETHAVYSGHAWVVSFDSGGVGNHHKGNYYYVRPVRSSHC